MTQEWLAGENEYGEDVMILKGDGFAKTRTYQSNGWVRVNCTYEKDEKIIEEEYYERPN